MDSEDEVPSVAQEFGMDFGVLEVYPDPEKLAVTGIRNSGATCFAACVMQIFMHLPRFVMFVLRLYPETEEMKAIEKFVMQYVVDSSTGRSVHFISPSVIEAMGFSHHVAASAHEFYMKLLDAYGGTSAWKTMKIAELFRIHMSRTTGYSFFTEIHTSLLLQYHNSVRESLALFLTRDVIESDNPRRWVQTEIRIAILPPVLCLNFDAAPKRGAPFHIYSELSEMDGTGVVNYSLYAVVEHIGAGSGHYKCLLKKNGKWWDCNDSSIREVQSIQKYLATGYVTGV